MLEMLLAQRRNFSYTRKSGKMIVKIYPTKDYRWGLFLIDTDATFLVGVSKHSHDVDLAAERMAKALRGMVDDPSQIVVDHCAQDRVEIMAFHEVAKAWYKSNARNI